MKTGKTQRIKQTLALALALLVIAASLVGCASKTGKAMLELDGTKLSENVFQLYLSRLKGSLCSSYLYGAEARTDAFWDKYMDTTGQTYNEYYTQMVLESAKNTLAALYVFDQQKMKLPDSYLEEIDAELNSLMEQDANGSKTEFDQLLSAYGASYDVLREARIIEAKVEYLTDTMVGANGEKLGVELIDEYYQNNYARFKQIFLYTYTVYKTDANGDEAYYLPSGKIAYDTAATAKLDAGGQPVKDENGDTVYVKENGRIAYDITKGVRKENYDSEGKLVQTQFSGAALEEILQKANGIYNALEAEDTVGFEAQLKANNEDTGMDKYTDGYYLTASTDFMSAEVVKKLFELEVGQVAKVRSEYGVHIIMRYELQDKGYDQKTTEDFFISTSTGTYVFMETLKKQWMNDYLSQYTDKIRILDESIFEEVNIKNVGVNFYY